MVQAVIPTTVTGLQGNPVATGTPGGNQSLTWNGTAWAAAGPFLSTTGGTLTGALTLAGNATAPLNPVSLQQLQAGYLAIAGGTITGSLVVNGSVNINSTGQTALTVGGRVVSGINSAGGFTGQGNITFYDTAGSNFLWSVSSQNGTLTFSNSNFFGPMVMDQNGDLTIRGALTQGSDETNKTNINPLAQGISLIRQLIPKSFAWITAPTVAHWGFIAQDVEGVIPTAVTQGAAPPGGGTALLSLDITAVLAAVTFAVKQLDERCTAIEAHDGITPPAAQLA